MSVVYIISDHGKLARDNEALEFTGRDGTVRKMFPHKLDCLIISGVVTITGAAMRLLIRRQINTLFISSNGKYNGKLVFNAAKNVLLRKKQFFLSDDEAAALPVAKAIVAAKIRNELGFVQRIKRKTGGEDECAGAVDALKAILDRVERAVSLDELRGHEGLAARHYFGVFRYNLIPEWASFPARSRNPPLSNVNAVLSFLYTLLMYRIETAVEAAGLDPMAGFLHATDYGKNALVFDLTEEFRTPVADTLCCALFNLGTLEPGDFREETTDDDMPSEEDEGGGGVGVEKGKAVLMTEKGLGKVIAGFEKKMETALYYQREDTRLSMNRIIIAQVDHFKRVVNGEEKEYRGFFYK